MDYQVLSKDILSLCGGTKNVISAGHCATRLRINVSNTNKVDKDAIEKLKGVIGIAINGNQVQVIIGQDVPNLYRAFQKIGGFEEGKTVEQGAKKNIAVRVIETIAGVFTPILPALCGAGMLKAILVLLTMMNVVENTSSTYKLIEVFSDSLFYFLPMFLAFTSAKKFDCNPYLAVSVAGILLHPTFTAMVASKEVIDFFGMNVPLISYSSSVIPIILTVWCMSYIEHFIDRYSPNALKFFSVPALTLLIAAPIALLVFGPIGDIMGGWLSAGITFMDSKASWLVITLMATFSPLIIMTGMHYSLFPIVFQSLATTGYTTLMSVSGLPSNMAEGGACFAVALKTKNKELRSMAISSGVTALMGITEPALYGVTLRLKKPLIAVLIAGGLGGLYASFVFLRSFGMVSPGLAAFPVFIDPTGDNANIINFVICCLIGFFAAFILTLIMGFEDVENEKITNENSNEEKEKRIEKISIYAPTEGEVVALKDVQDQVFSGGIMGKGIAIKPANGMVVAPVDGVITSLFPSKHAIGITSKEGCEVLVHIGIDTVNLQGKYFENFAELHQNVNKGEKIVEFDLEAMQAEALDTTICIIVTNTKEYFDVVETQATYVQVLDEIAGVL